MAKGKFSVGVEVRGFNRSENALRGVVRRLTGIGRQSQRVSRGFQRANKQVKGFGRSLRGLKGLGFSGLIGGGLGVGAFQGLTKMTEYADKIGKLADRLGISTDRLQQWRYAANQAGMSVEQFDSSFERFSKRAGEAKRNFGPALRAFNELRINGKNAGGEWKNTEQLFYEVADAIAGIEDPNRKAALAAQFFGREGVAMVNMLKNGAKGVREFEKKAKDLNLIINEKMIRSSEDFNDSLDTLKKTMSVNVSNAIGGLLPKLTDLSNGFTEWVNEAENVKHIEEAFESTLGFAKGAATGFREVAETVKGFGNAITNFLPNGEKLKTALGEAETAGKAAAVAISGIVGLAILGKFANLARNMAGIAGSMKSIGKKSPGFSGSSGKGFGRFGGATPVYVTNMGVGGLLEAPGAGTGKSVKPPAAKTAAAKVGFKAGSKLAAKGALKAVPIVGSVALVGEALEHLGSLPYFRKRAEEADKKHGTVSFDVEDPNAHAKDIQEKGIKTGPLESLFGWHHRMKSKHSDPTAIDLYDDPKPSKTEVVVSFKDMPKGARVTDVQHSGPAEVKVNESSDMWNLG